MQAAVRLPGPEPRPSGLPGAALRPSKARAPIDAYRGFAFFTYLSNQAIHS